MIAREKQEKFSSVLATSSDMLGPIKGEPLQKGCVNNMNSRIGAWLVMGLGAWVLSASAQAPSGRIATVDLNRVFNEYYKTPMAQGKLKETVDSYTKEQDEMMATYKKGIDELNKLREEQEKSEYTAEVREQKRKAVAEKLAETQKQQRDIEDYRASHQKILQEQTQRMRQTILKEINEVIGKEARDQNYMMVLDKSGNTLNGVPALIFSQDSLEITDDVVKILNKSQLKTTESPKPAEKKGDKK
jgi:outer membrane protein